MAFPNSFDFSTGLIPYMPMLITVKNFHAATGRNPTNDKVQFLQNTILVFYNGFTPSANHSSVLKSKRDFNLFTALVTHDIQISVNPARRVA